MAVPGAGARLVRVNLGERRGGGVPVPGVPPLPGVRAGDPTGYVVLGWATGTLLLAAWLHRQGYRSMCSVLRTPQGLLGIGFFLGHLADLWGWLDPINAASRRIPQRRFP